MIALHEPFAGTVLAPGSLGRTLALLAGVIAASAVLYRFVERPFRQHPRSLRWTAVAAVALLLLALAVTGRADDAVASPGETRDSLEQAAADARFPREERHAAAGRIAQHYAGQGPEVRR